MSILDALTRVLRPDDTLYVRSLRALADDDQVEAAS
jgi:hypothetical protein